MRWRHLSIDTIQWKHVCFVIVLTGVFQNDIIQTSFFILFFFCFDYWNMKFFLNMNEIWFHFYLRQIIGNFQKQENIYFLLHISNTCRNSIIFDITKAMIKLYFLEHLSIAFQQLISTFCHSMIWNLYHWFWSV